MSKPPGEQTDLATGLTRLSVLLMSAENAEQALRHLAAVAAAVIPNEPTCGIIVRRHGRHATMVHAGSLSAAVHDAGAGAADRGGIRRALVGPARWGSTACASPR